MSESVTLPRRPLLGNQRVIAWKAKVLQRLGWTSKTAQQEVTHNELTMVAQTLEQNVLRGGGGTGATATRDLRKGSTKQFLKYHDLLAAFEQAEERTTEMAAELKTAAQAYLDHYEKHGQKQKNDPKNKAKKESCEATIRSLRSLELSAKVQVLGAPPWDTARSMQAASLKTAFDIMSLPPDEQQIERLTGEDNASPAFWINQRDGGQTKKSFIFKPSSQLGGGTGYPPGGEPGREALSGRVAEMLNGALGLTLPMPETQVIELGREMLPEDSVEQLVRDGALTESPSYVGSVQKFERVQGSMRQMSMEDLNRIPTRATQELALFDTILLNTDRHAGNLLFRPGEDDTPQIVPIDHGLCLPPQRAGIDITTNFGSTHNALLRLPGSHEPFSDDMQGVIAQLDPDALAEMLKRERTTIETAHPSTGGTVSDQAIESSRRSVVFLKRAAKQLTPAAVQVAIAQFNAELFDPERDMKDFDQLVDSIIEEVKGQQEALKEYFTMPPELQAKMKQDLTDNGWSTGGRLGASDAVQLNPANALRLWKSNIKNPDVNRDPNRRPIELDENTVKELAEAQRAFPKMTMPSEDDGQRNVLAAWRDWQQLGGTPEKLRTALSMAGATSISVTAACRDIVKAVAYLKKANAVRQIFENDDTDPQIVELRTNVAYLEQIGPVLLQALRNELNGLLQRGRDAIDANPPLDGEIVWQILADLLQIRTRAVDQARSRLLSKLDIYAQRAPDERLRKHAIALKAEAESYSIIRAYTDLRQLDQALADAE